MKVETADHIHAHLRALGLNARKWALANGYHPRTVLACISSFAPNEKRLPVRPKSKQIMAALSETIGVDLLGANNDK